MDHIQKCLISEACAADQLGTDLHDIDIDWFFHLVADNMDHNSITIDRRNTFHGKGIIAYYYQQSKGRLQKSVISSKAKLKTKFYSFSCDIKPLKMFKDICCNVALDNTKVLGRLWQLRGLLHL